MDQNDVIYELLDRTARIDSKLDILVDSLSKHDNRLQAVEGHVNRGFGVVAVITFAITTFGQALWHKMFGQSS